ncbi:RNA dependent RNA polymerase-domain-containing protein [Infundibulicybe gibba]|nr:RNA dependent RNA polymerase-domain-containing protein [Infundibulicybe gibba]
MSQTSDEKPPSTVSPSTTVAWASPSAHEVRLQHCYDKRSLPYGVQYEIARLVSRGRIRHDQILLEDLDEIAKLGSNAQAVPRTAQILLARYTTATESGPHSTFSKEMAAKVGHTAFPWAEFDSEEEALRNDPYAGLGFNDQRPPVVCSGRIHFDGTLHEDTTSSKEMFKVVLEPAELGPSNQLQRRFGSKSIFRLKAAKSALNKKSEDRDKFYLRPLVLCNGVFRVFHHKDDNYFYFRTDEGYDGLNRRIKAGVVPNALSFTEFLDWHNPIRENQSQSMAKWASRFGLALSSSAPGLKLEPTQVVNLEDISQTCEIPVVSPEGSDMTDGAGTINNAALKQLCPRFGWGHHSAVQVRVKGAKGLLIHDPHNKSETPQIGLRPSQVKIKYSNLDSAQLVIDVLRVSHPRGSSRLSVEILTNLADNGVPASVLIELLRRGLDESISPLLQWEGEDAMRTLWRSLCQRGVYARAMGYSERDAEEMEEDEDGFRQVDPDQRSSAWWGDDVSGCPSSLEETAMTLLDSGFTPQECPILRQKIKSVIETSVKNYVETCRIDIPMSVTAFLVPDPLGILKPGEIFFKSSTTSIKVPNAFDTDILLGPVLLTRHPCKLPTDTQAWTAVDRPELHDLVDVIVLPTQGDRRAADLLAGGDYDGDKGLLLYQPELVKHFKNAPLKYSHPPANIRANFSQHTEMVSDFLERVKDMSPESRRLATQRYLIGSDFDASLIGQYSKFHDIATYTLGYRHPETIRLAYMFCMTLDGSKTGLKVRPEVLATDRSKYHKRPPAWSETEKQRKQVTDNSINPIRPKGLSPFIMDIIHEAAKQLAQDKFAELMQIFGNMQWTRPDPELEAPWNLALEEAARWMKEENSTRRFDDLEKIKGHVESVYAEYRDAISLKNKERHTAGSPRKGAAFSALSIETRQDVLRALSKRFASGPSRAELLMSEEELSRLCASYAYIYDIQQRKGSRGEKWTRFAWDMAMRDITRASGRHKTIVGDFYDYFSIKRSSMIPTTTST